MHKNEKDLRLWFNNNSYHLFFYWDESSGNNYCGLTILSYHLPINGTHNYVCSADIGIENIFKYFLSEMNSINEYYKYDLISETKEFFGFYLLLQEAING